MTHRLRAGLAGLLTATCVWCALATPTAIAQAEAKTEDVVYMRDGRILHGQVLEESRTEVVFEFIDPNINITTKLTLRKSDIEQIKHDLPLESVQEEPAESATSDPMDLPADAPAAANIPTREERKGRIYGAQRGAMNNEDLPGFYVVPMRGQMGTDISSEVYREMIDDIREANPSLLIIELDCDELHETEYYGIEEEESGLDGSTALDDYRKVVQIFHNELRDIPQVVWVKDSVGVSSIVALSWKDLYMKPGARLGGLAKTAINFLRVKHDENTFGKYREAYMAWLKGFVSYGGYDLDLIDAMVRPEFKLSATWHGREVDWLTSEDGQYIVDGDEEATVSFYAKAAEDLCISKGTAETLDDLALLLGIREYRVIEGDADKIYDGYVSNWRRAFDMAAEEMNNYRKYMGWASGQDAVKYLGRAKTSLEKVLAAMNRYESVEIRFLMGGLSRFQIETQIEVLKEQIRQARASGTGGVGGGGGGGGGPFGR